MARMESEIAHVEAQLDSAVESLAAMHAGNSGLDPLREAVRLLEGMHVAAIQAPPAKTLEPAIRRIAQRAARAQELLDSAAAFYLGWIGALPSVAEDYTAEGGWAPAAPGSRVLAEA